MVVTPTEEAGERQFFLFLVNKNNEALHLILK